MLLLMSRLHGGELARELLGCLQLAVAKFRGRFDLAAFVPFIPAGHQDPVREGRRRPASDLVEGFALGKPSRVVGVDAVKNGGSFGRNLVSDEPGPSGILLPKGGDYFFPAIELELPDCATIDEDYRLVPHFEPRRMLAVLVHDVSEVVHGALHGRIAAGRYC